MDRKSYPENSLSAETVNAYCKFQFSGSGIANFSGTGFRGCIVSGTTYTLQFAAAAPQLMNLDATCTVASGASPLTVAFNGNQVNQPTVYFTGSNAAMSSSGQSQTIDFNVWSGASLTTVPYSGGANWCFVRATFLNQNYSRG